MGWVLHVRLTGQLAGSPASTDAGIIAQLLRLPASPPRDQWPASHPLLPLLEAAAALTPRVEPISEEEFFAGLGPHDVSRLGPFLEQLRVGPRALAVLASSRLAARAAGVRLLCQPPPPGRGITWSQVAPRFYRLLDPARFLAPLPLAYLWTLPPQLEVLQRLGVWRIGQISGRLQPEAGSRPAPRAAARNRGAGTGAWATIPQSLLVERLGATLARQLVEASQGLDPTPVRIAFPHPALQREGSLPDGFDGSELPELLTPLATSLAQELAAQGMGASRLTLRLLPPANSRSLEGSEAGPAARQASRRFPEPLGDPSRLAREAWRLARGLLVSPPPPGTRLVLEADGLAPAAARQAAGLVMTGEAPELTPALADFLEEAHRRFGQAAPVPASTLPVSRRERMLRLWLRPPGVRPCGGL